MAAEKLWRYFYAYGDWTDSVSGKNFVVCRCPEGRLPWSKKLMPKLHRVLKMWYGVKVGDWWIDGFETPTDATYAWYSNNTCYEWTGDDWRLTSLSERLKEQETA